MADIKINEKLVVSQTGTAEPVLASNVDLSSATGIPAAGITGTLGSGVTFPAGHMILLGQTRVTSAAESSTALTYTKTGLGTSSRDLDITIAEATVALYSKIIVSVSWAIQMSAGSSRTISDWKFRRENSGGDSDLGAATRIGAYVVDTGRIYILTKQECDTSLPASGDVTYSLQFRKTGGTAAYCGSIFPLSASDDPYETGIIMAYGVV